MKNPFLKLNFKRHTRYMHQKKTLKKYAAILYIPFKICMEMRDEIFNAPQHLTLFYMGGGQICHSLPTNLHFFISNFFISNSTRIFGKK